MGDKPVKPPWRKGKPRAGERDTDVTVLTPPVGLPESPRTQRGQPPPSAGGGRRVDPPVEPPGAARACAPCVCGHARDAHEHYRSGSDCGICGAAKCAAYRRHAGLVRRMLRRVLVGRRDEQR